MVKNKVHILVEFHPIKSYRCQVRLKVFEKFPMGRGGTTCILYSVNCLAGFHTHVNDFVRAKAYMLFWHLASTTLL